MDGSSSNEQIGKKEGPHVEKEQSGAGKEMNGRLKDTGRLSGPGIARAASFPSDPADDSRVV